jgi:hypothetical protein
MKQIMSFFQKIYRLSIGIEKQQQLVWEDLKALHCEAEWRCGVYESEKYLETIFEIAEDTPGTYYYMLRDGQFHTVVEIARWFKPEQTTEMFILASHFNNILNSGVVTVNVKRLVVEYRIQRDLLVPLLYDGEICGQLIKHFDISKDLYWACQKLVHGNEEPALIIADLFKKRENEIQ